MQVHELKIQYHPDILFTLKETKEEFEKEGRFLLALKLYELGKLSSGNAAKLAGISRKEFLLNCGKYKVSIFSDDIDDLHEEIENV